MPKKLKEKNYTKKMMEKRWRMRIRKATKKKRNLKNNSINSLCKKNQM
jgi:hypothetical protein